MSETILLVAGCIVFATVTVATLLYGYMALNRAWLADDVANILGRSVALRPLRSLRWCPWRWCRSPSCRRTDPLEPLVVIELEHLIGATEGDLVLSIEPVRGRLGLVRTEIRRYLDERTIDDDPWLLVADELVANAVDAAIATAVDTAVAARPAVLCRWPSDPARVVLTVANVGPAFELPDADGHAAAGGGPGAGATAGAGPGRRDRGRAGGRRQRRAVLAGPAGSEGPT